MCCQPDRLMGYGAMIVASVGHPGLTAWLNVGMGLWMCELGSLKKNIMQNQIISVESL